jgi:hypothetical protein
MVGTLDGSVSKHGSGQSRSTADVAAESTVIAEGSGSPSPRRRKLQQLGAEGVSAVAEVKKRRRPFVFFVLWYSACDYTLTC